MGHMIELRSFRHVVALADTLNYIRAGEALSLSQSALTRSIQAVESRCGMQLFDRNRGGVHLTSDGRAFVERARVLLANAEDITTFVQRASKGEEGDLPFGIEPMPARALLPAVLAPSLANKPNMRNRVLVRCIDALWDLLKDGEIDFFISAVSPLPAALTIRTKVLGSFPLSFLVRAGHPALTTASDRGPYPVLLAGEANSFGTLPPRLGSLISGPRHIVEDYEILAKLLVGSDAILISSSLAVREEVAKGLIVELPYDDQHGAPRIPIVMHSLERRSLSTSALRLQSSFEQQLQALLVP